MSRNRCFVTIATAALLAAPASPAMINPGFTPVQLAKQAGVILWVDITAGEAKDPYTATIRETLKGNNDGRQDVVIAYSAADPTIFFNRGFRSFGNAASINMGWKELLPASMQGQTSACIGDLDDDGAQDLVLALNNGEVWVAFRENDNPDRLAIMAVAVLPVGGPNKGPVAVSGWIGKRCLGAWNVLPGVSQACFGRTDAGPVTLEWRLPGGKKQTKEVVLEKAGTLKVEIK